MAVQYRREYSSAARWSWRAASFSLVLLVTSGVGHRYGLVETEAFYLVLGIVFLLSVLGLSLSVQGLSDFWYRGDAGGRRAASAALVSVLVLAPFTFGIAQLVLHPALTDISTDLVEPPSLSRAQLLRTPRMNPIVPISDEQATLQLTSYPDVTGRRFEASMERVFSAVVAVVDQSGWKPRTRLPDSVAVSEFAFEAEAPTLILRLPADAAIRLTDEGETVFVDLRLNSRYLRHDLGDNARRIRAFMAELDAEFERQSLRIIDIPPSDGDEDGVD